MLDNNGSGLSVMGTMVPDSPAGRFVAIIAMVPGLTFAELDRLVGSKVQGQAKQIANGKEPRAATLRKFAAVLGVSPGYVLFGEGVPPCESSVSAAVSAARDVISRARTPHIGAGTRD